MSWREVCTERRYRSRNKKRERDCSFNVLYLAVSWNDPLVVNFRGFEDVPNLEKPPPAETPSKSNCRKMLRWNWPLDQRLYRMKKFGRLYALRRSVLVFSKK